MGALTTRLSSDCQAIVRCLATNINVAVRNGMQCIGEHPCCPVRHAGALLLLCINSHTARAGSYVSRQASRRQRRLAVEQVCLAQPGCPDSSLIAPALQVARRI